MEIFCDFDGTITTEDLLDIIILKHYGKEKKDKFDTDIKEGIIEHNKQLELIFNDMNYNLDEMISIIDNELTEVIDPYFKLFYDKCNINNINLYIISGGIKKIITHYLSYFNKENIYANDIDFSTFLNKFLPLSKTLNKSSIIKKVRSKNKKIIYVGDGLSDFDVIKYVDILYVKKNSILEEHCNNKNVSFKTFENFSDLLSIFNVQSNLKLLSPGIVRGHPLVLNELKFQHTFMHRDLNFKKLYNNIDIQLKNIVCTEPEKYVSLIVTGSGTTSMDVVINCIVNHGKTLFISNGLFGERWINIGNFYNSNNVYIIKNDWGKPFNITNIINFINDKDIKYLVMVHCDTSIGILNPIKEIGNKLKQTKCQLIVDTVSSFGVVPINMENDNISILITNPNKSISSYMGIGIIIGKNDILENFTESKCGSYSLNLKRNYLMALRQETCNSVSISSLNALNASLYLYYKDTIKINEMYKKYNFIFNYFYNKIIELKQKPLLEKNLSCPAIITILKENSNQFIEILKENNFVVYPCKGYLNNKGYQVSFYGYDTNIKNINQLLDLIKSN